MNAFRRFVALAVVVSALPAPTAIAWQAENTPPAAGYMPSNLAVVVTVRDGDRQVTSFRKLLETHRFTESPTYRALQNNPQFMQARVGLAGLAVAADTDVWTGMGALLGREFMFGLAPVEGDEPQFIAVSVPRDAQLADRVLSTIYVVAGLTPNGEPDPDRSQQIGGVTVFTLPNDTYHCRLDQAIVLSNNIDLVRSAIEGRQQGASMLDASETYQQAFARANDDAAIWAYGDMNILRHAIAGGEPPAQLPNPLAAVMFGGWRHSILHAESAVITATPRDNQLAIDLTIDSSEPLPATHRGFAPSHLEQAQWSAASLPGFVSAVTIARDWEDLFAEREALMTLSAAGDFVNFTNTLTTLMGQVDFVDEIMAHVSGPIKLVLTRQDFTARSYAPTPELPAFALVLPVEFPDGADIQRRLHSASLSALSILNVDAGQNQRPTFLLDVDRYRGHRIVTAAYPDPKAGDAGMGMDRGANEQPSDNAEVEPQPTDGVQSVGIAYNFAPCIAVLDKYYIVATSPKLLRRLIDGVDAAEPLGAAKDDLIDSLSINVAELTAVLRANREAFVASSMLDKDKPREQAERDIDAVFGALDYADRVELNMRQRGQSQSATLTLTLRGGVDDE